MPERLTRAVVRFRLAVVGAWIAVVVLGVLAGGALPGLLANSFAVPGTDSERARTILAERFGERTDGVFTVVFRTDRGGDRALRAALRRRLERAARVVPTARVGELRRGGGLVYADLLTELELQRAKTYTGDVRRALRGPGPRAFVTGQPAIQHDLDGVFAGDLRRGEAIALPVALAVLVAVLGLSLAVAIPFVVAAGTVAAGLAAVWAFAHALPMVTYVTNLVELIGIGLAIDYSLLVVHRFREELRRGLPVEDAVVATMATAGRAVAVSGATVAVGLALLLVTPVPFVRSLGLAGLVVPVASIAAAATLQPALLALLGRRLARRPGRGRPPERGFWTRLAGVIMRRPYAFLAAGGGLLVAAAVPVAFLGLTPGSLAGLPPSVEAIRGFDLLRDRVGPGIVTPTQVVVDAGAPGRARGPAVQAAIDRLGDLLVRDPEAYVIASGPRRPYVAPGGRYARLVVAGRHEYGAPETRAFVHRLRDRLVPRARFPGGVRVYAGGAPPQGVDFVSRSYGAFPWLVAGVLALTFVLLLRAFRSLLLPLKAVVLNVLTVAAVYGLLVVVFRFGAGRSEVDAWIPIFLFAVLFGLSMDYEVFLVARMREAWDRLGENAAAVAYGLERTGRIVTAAAAIMIAAFAGFAVGRVAPLQEFGAGLALAVLVDATLVRAVLVPALMAVLGRWNWWLPERVARVARVAPSPLAPRTRGGAPAAPLPQSAPE